MAAIGLSSGLRQREQRIDVTIPSRMRVDDSWIDVCIRNISPHGLLVAVANPPPRGNYVEIRRGTQIIVARSMWTDGQYCGLRAQELLPVQQIIAEPRLSRRPAVAVVATAADRRRDDCRTGAAAIADREIRSRRFAAAFQFAVFAVVALGVSGWAAMSVYRSLAAPIATVEHALSG